MIKWKIEVPSTTVDSGWVTVVECESAADVILYLVTSQHPERLRVHHVGTGFTGNAAEFLGRMQVEFERGWDRTLNEINKGVDTR